MIIGNLILGANSVTVSYLIHYDSLLQNETYFIRKCVIYNIYIYIYIYIYISYMYKRFIYPNCGETNETFWEKVSINLKRFVATRLLAINPL